MLINRVGGSGQGIATGRGTGSIVGNSRSFTVTGIGFIPKKITIIHLGDQYYRNHIIFFDYTESGINKTEYKQTSNSTYTLLLDTDLDVVTNNDGFTVSSDTYYEETSNNIVFEGEYQWIAHAEE